MDNYALWKIRTNKEYCEAENPWKIRTLSMINVLLPLIKKVYTKKELAFMRSGICRGDVLPNTKLYKI